MIIFVNGFLDWRLNTTFISLIPKEQGIIAAKDFRPIALLSGLYKLVAKVLANRLQVHLPSLVSDCQGVALEGRQIQDLSLIANELLDSRLTSKQDGYVLKLNFYKAFDCVNWEFLDQLLVSYGFSSKWRVWLSTSRKTTSFLIFLNGSVGKTFKGSRGLRQGDPLSPMFFILVAEVLTQFFLKAQSLGILEGFKVIAKMEWEY